MPDGDPEQDRYQHDDERVGEESAHVANLRRTPNMSVSGDPLMPNGLVITPHLRRPIWSPFAV